MSTDQVVIIGEVTVVLPVELRVCPLCYAPTQEPGFCSTAHARRFAQIVCSERPKKIGNWSDPVQA